MFWVSKCGDIFMASVLVGAVLTYLWLEIHFVQTSFPGFFCQSWILESDQPCPRMTGVRKSLRNIDAVKIMKEPG